MNPMVLIAAVLIPGPALEPSPAPVVSAYDCHLVVSADDLPDTVQDIRFKAAAAQSGPHGGEETLFTFGAHQVGVIANARWKGLTWTKNKVLLANALTVMDRDSVGSQVLMAYNPAKPETEFVSLDCSPAEAAPTVSQPQH